MGAEKKKFMSNLEVRKDLNGNWVKYLARGEVEVDVTGNFQ